MRHDLAAARSMYGGNSVLSASPARILTMLYDRLLLDLQRAETAQRLQDWQGAAPHLLHAQDIVTELISSLRPELWTGGPGLLALYGYVSEALVGANVRHDIGRTRECIGLLEPLRLAWHEAETKVALDAGAGRRDLVG